MNERSVQNGSDTVFVFTPVYETPKQIKLIKSELCTFALWGRNLKPESRSTVYADRRMS